MNDKTQDKTWIYINILIAIIIPRILIQSLLVCWLWNWLMPELLAIKELPYLQALGLFMMLRILFMPISRNIGTP